MRVFTIMTPESSEGPLVTQCAHVRVCVHITLLHSSVLPCEA